MKNRYTPEKITKLKENEIFVFGSNAEGKHAGGAANLALKKFGAKMGISRGITGECYAIDTMSGLDVLKEQIEPFIKAAKILNKKTFLVTKIGCGIAGFNEKEIAILFKGAKDVPNIHLPESFFDIITTVKGYKGFNKNLKCRKFQYKENEINVHEGSVKACNSGFHYCENSLDMFKYYPPKNENVFYEVEGFGELHRENTDSKISVSKIKIGIKLSLKDIIKNGTEFIFEKVNIKTSHLKNKDIAPVSGNSSTSATSGDSSTSATSGYYSTSATSGNSSTSATSGNYSTSATSGDYSTSATSGDYSTSATSGNYSTSATSGNYSTSATSGNYSTSATSGNSSTSATSGNYSTSATSGNYSTSATSGNSSTSATSGNSSTSATSGNYSTSATSSNYSTSATSGYYSTSATSGDYSTSATSGDYSTSATSGNSSTSATSGNYSTSATSGNSSTSAVTGKNSIAVSNGIDVKAKGTKGNWIVLSEYKNGNISTVKCVKIDGKKIKENTLYTLVEGEFKEFN